MPYSPDHRADGRRAQRAAEMELHGNRGPDMRDEPHPTEHRPERNETKTDEARQVLADEPGPGRDHEPDDGERLGQRNRDEVGQW